MEQRALYHTVNSEACLGWCYTNLEYGSVFMYVKLWTSQQRCRRSSLCRLQQQPGKTYWGLKVVSNGLDLSHGPWFVPGIWLKEWCHRYMQLKERVGSAVERTRGCGVPEGAQSSRCTSTSKGARSWKCCRGSPRLEYLLSPLPPADGQKEDGKISRRLTDTEVFLSRAVSVANLKLMRSV